MQLTKTHKTKKSSDVYAVEYERYLADPEKYPLTDACAEIVKEALEIAGYLAAFAFSEAKTREFLIKKNPSWTSYTAKAKILQAKEIWAIDGQINKRFEQRRIHRERWALYEKVKDKRPEVAQKILSDIEKSLPADPIEAPDVSRVFMFPSVFVPDPTLLGLTLKEIEKMDKEANLIKEKWISENTHLIEEDGEAGGAD